MHCAVFVLFLARGKLPHWAATAYLQKSKLFFFMAGVFKDSSDLFFVYQVTYECVLCEHIFLPISQWARRIHSKRNWQDFLFTFSVYCNLQKCMKIRLHRRHCNYIKCCILAIFCLTLALALTQWFYFKAIFKSTLHNIF